MKDHSRPCGFTLIELICPSSSGRMFTRSGPRRPSAPPRRSTRFSARARPPMPRAHRGWHMWQTSAPAAWQVRLSARPINTTASCSTRCRGGTAHNSSATHSPSTISRQAMARPRRSSSPNDPGRHCRSARGMSARQRRFSLSTRRHPPPTRPRASRLFRPWEWRAQGSRRSSITRSPRPRLIRCRR